MLSNNGAFACRYPLSNSAWEGAHDTVLYFIVEDLDVKWTDGVPEILDCYAVDVVAVV